MDGTHRKIIVTYDVKWPNGLTLDLVQSRIYWVDAKLNIISSCDYDGMDRRLVLHSSVVLKHPFSISTFEDWIYWTDWERHTIYKANKFTGKNFQNIIPLHMVSAIIDNYLSRYQLMLVAVQKKLSLLVGYSYRDMDDFMNLRAGFTNTCYQFKGVSKK